MRVVLLSLILTFLISCNQPAQPSKPLTHAEVQKRFSRSTNKVFQGALAQLENPAHYDGGYYAISYPNGDVPIDRGACTDVVIRALRNDGHDLQSLVSADIDRGGYKVKQKDKNIDHRRVPNLAIFFKRHGQSLPLATNQTELPTWKPGDIVCWKLLGNRDHIGIVSDKKNAYGVPYVIHNTAITSEEDVLNAWQIVGHYRYP